MMKSKILYWVPRVLGILFAAFISLFSLDVFAESNYGVLETLIAFVMHNVPTALVIIDTSSHYIMTIKFNLVRLTQTAPNDLFIPFPE